MLDMSLPVLCTLYSPSHADFCFLWRIPLVVNTGPNKLHTVSHILKKEKSPKLWQYAQSGAPISQSIRWFHVLIQCGLSARVSWCAAKLCDLPNCLSQRLSFAQRIKQTTAASDGYVFIIRRSLDLLFCLHVDLQLHSEQKLELATYYSQTFWNDQWWRKPVGTKLINEVIMTAWIRTFIQVSDVKQHLLHLAGRAPHPFGQPY